MTVDVMKVCSVPQVLYGALLRNKVTYTDISGVPRNFVGGGVVHQIQLRTEDRENGDLGPVAP